ncbi:hypothetical protein D3C71_2108550 [compost metagenome]
MFEVAVVLNVAKDAKLCAHKGTTQLRHQFFERVYRVTKRPGGRRDPLPVEPCCMTGAVHQFMQ